MSLFSKIVAVMAGVLAPAISFAQLNVTYGTKGLATLTYNGVSLANTSTNSGDVFHIWHAKSTNISDGSTNGLWGEDTTSQNWNASTLTETYNYTFGNITTQYVQNGNTLNMVTTITNNAGSGIIYNGAEIYAVTLHFPQEPAGFFGYTQYVHPSQQIPYSVADYGTGVVTSVLTDASKSVYIGWKNQGTYTYTALMSATYPDGYSGTNWELKDSAVQPGTSLTYTISLRFTNEGTTASVSDAVSSFASTYPSTLNWTDRRIIGDAYLAGADNPNNPTGDKTQPDGFPNNPRRWFNDSNVNTLTGAGLAAFQQRIMQQAQTIVTNSQTYGAQGTVTWDIEGEQYPQDTSYVCSPDQIETVAPEMASIIPSGNGTYSGMKLIDAYFKIQTDAGLKVGVCVRPQHFSLFGNNQAQQTFNTTNATALSEAKAKVQYAHDRWGARLFYVDSVVNTNGGKLDPSVMQGLAAAFPDSLIIPEQTWGRNHAYNGAYKSFIFLRDIGTDPSVYAAYPNAFSVNAINDVDPSVLAQYRAAITAQIVKGDIMMIHTDNYQPNNATVKQMYADAAAVTPTPTPTPVIPTPTVPCYQGYVGVQGLIFTH